jgi:hypothetical protein
MATIFIDAPGDEQRRQSLYAGDLHLLRPMPGFSGLVELARQLAEEAFAPLDPEFAHEHMPVESYVDILAQLKPRFIHRPEAKEEIRLALVAAGCDIEKTYFDVPRLRTMVCGDYLKAGLALQFHPHRDTWFSAPFQQLNWWLPVFPVAPENTLAFHPLYFDAPVRNSSSEYDYAQWIQTGRQQAAKILKVETRRQPQPLEPVDTSSEVRFVPPVAGTILFSAAQLHSTVPNTSDRTRFSIDFRTVNIDDLADGIRAPNIDSECAGTTIRDFVRASDLAPLPEAIVARLEREPVAGRVGR